jgi:integrator complex subunit 3
MGRDFIRAIQDVIKLHEFESLWRDMHRAPERLCPRFNSIEVQFFGRPSAVEMLNVRLTPNMESKLYFILDGQPKTVGWTFLFRFKKTYLSTPESEWLIPDIIRYICALDFRREVTDHPKYLQRWEVIRNLLLSIKNEIVAQNAKLALFYDWLFFTEEIDTYHRLGMIF